MDNLEEMEKFSETHSLPRLNQEEIENIKRPIISTENELWFNKSPNKALTKVQDWMASEANFIKYLEKNTYPVTLPQNVVEGTLPNSFYEATITLTPQPKMPLKEIKLQANITDEPRHKNSQLNTKKPNPTMC